MAKHREDMFDDSAVPFRTMGADEYAEFAFRHGAAVAFGLMGMAEAIRAWHLRQINARVLERNAETFRALAKHDTCTCAARHGHFSHCATKKVRPSYRPW